MADTTHIMYVTDYHRIFCADHADRYTEPRELPETIGCDQCRYELYMTTMAILRGENK